jgi:hypothetical protein
MGAKAACNSEELIAFSQAELHSKRPRSYTVGMLPSEVQHDITAILLPLIDLCA